MVLSDQEMEDAASAVAEALSKMSLRTNLARGWIAVVALEDAGFTIERLDPGPVDHIEHLLKASLADRGATAELVNGCLDATIVKFPR